MRCRVALLDNKKESTVTTTPPLSHARTLVHTREIICKGYQRSDGLLDIEGRLQDLSSAGTDLPFHSVPEGGAIHDMRLLMTIDADLVIQQITACTDTGATPFCSAITDAYASLKGLKIAGGFKRQANACIGGVRGCTHLTELLERMANVAMQTMFAVRRARSRDKTTEGEQEIGMTRIWAIGKCHAYREDGEAVQLLWPQGLPGA
jgi:hypothetical protein